MPPAAPAEAKPAPARAPVANAVATGLLLGVMQWSVFFLLQSYLASTAVVYLLATCAWLLGGLGGMFAPGAHEPRWLAAAVLSFYLLRYLAQAHPYELGWLPVLLALVAIMGGYAGRFFKGRAGVFPATRWLFFWENNGFLGGLLVTAAALYALGDTYFLVGPALAAALVAATGHRLIRAPAAAAPAPAAIAAPAAPAPAPGPSAARPAAPAPARPRRRRAAR
jgi:hypothetical protein